jgi:hypothetical protein
LHLPHDGQHLDVIRTKVFEDYIRDNVVTWFNWAQKKGLGVERMEDLILVSGCSLVTSWAAAVFVDHAEISLAIHPHKSGGEDINWGKIQGPIAHHNRPFDPVCPPYYIHSLCADHYPTTLKEPASGSMCLRQRVPSKARLVLDQKNAGCG